MNRRYRKIALLAALVLLATAFIFSNSLKNSQESYADSDVILKIVEDVAEKIAPKNCVDWSYIVRKSAHLFEFFVLGVFTTLLFLQVNRSRRVQVVSAFLYVTVIAAGDECIQYFTGRTSCMTDVFIDVSGALAGIGVICLWHAWRKRRRCGEK